MRPELGQEENHEEQEKEEEEQEENQKKQELEEPLFKGLFVILFCYRGLKKTKTSKYAFILENTFQSLRNCAQKIFGQEGT